jgi:hypothetical protein
MSDLFLYLATQADEFCTSFAKLQAAVHGDSNFLLLYFLRFLRSSNALKS